MTRHRRGEPITPEQARAEVEAMTDEVDRRRRGEDTGPRVPRYVEPPATGPADIPVVASDGDNPPDDATADTIPPTSLPDADIDQTQPGTVVRQGENAGDVRPLNRLDHAARLLRARGRARGVLVTDTGCMCLVAALAAVSGVSADDMRAAEVAPGGDEAALVVVYYEVNSLPETAHLAGVVAQSSEENAGYARTTAPVHTLWYWADRVEDDEVLRLLAAAADTFEAVA